MKRIYVRWDEWECYKNGMWRTITDKAEYESMLSEAIEFTGDHAKYGSAMNEVIFAWTKTMLHNLTNSSTNKQAFIGHCAVTYTLSIPEYITRAAWKVLSDEQRYLANCEADKAFGAWKYNHLKNPSQCEIGLIGI